MKVHDKANPGDVGAIKALYERAVLDYLCKHARCG